MTKQLRVDAKTFKKKRFVYCGQKQLGAIGIVVDKKTSSGLPIVQSTDKTKEENALYRFVVKHCCLPKVAD